MPPKRWYVPLFVALLGACVMFLAGAEKVTVAKSES